MSDTPRYRRPSGLALSVFSRELEREIDQISKQTTELVEEIKLLKGQLSLSQDREQELQWQIDGYTKCDSCDGDGGRCEGSHGRLGSPNDPQTWVNCDSCDGEGWVKL